MLKNLKFWDFLICIFKFILESNNKFHFLTKNENKNVLQ